MKTMATKKDIAQTKSKTKAPFVVGIGVSAGGLKPLQEFFGSMPHDSGLAFVIVQHLSPEFKSLMSELLSRHTDMALHRVEHGMALEANSIYFIPPKKNIVISKKKLLLTDQDLSRGHPLNFPIDIFFNSLAVSLDDRAVGVILSGTGTDGTLGVRAINEAGGVILVQSPESAEFDGMPQSVIDTGRADYVLPPCELARAIYDYVTKAPGGLIKDVPESEMNTAPQQMVLLQSADAAQSDGAIEYDADSQAAQRIADLELDLELNLEQTSENLQATIDELESTNEEQQATNRELLASNEELQSANEELQSKIGELLSLNNDMDNLLLSTDIGTVFLDKELRIRRFTPAVTRVIKLMEHDIGRPLDQIAYGIEMEQGDLLSLVKRVLQSGQQTECEAQSRNRTSLLLRLNPYRDETGQAVGVVLTFVDISALKRAELQSRLLQTLMHAISSSTDFDAAMESTLSNVCRMFDWDYAEAWLPQNDERVLTCCSTFIARPELEPFRTVRGELKLAADSGLPGRVWNSKKPQWILDLAKESELLHNSDVAAEVGLTASMGVPIVVPSNCSLKSAFGLPILTQDDVEVVLTFFMRTKPQKRDLKSVVDLLSPVGSQLGAVVQRKRLDAALHEANIVLQQKNEQLEQFVHTVSHDLKSPLVSIGGVLGILKEELKEGQPVDAAEIAEIIATGENTVARMQGLIEDLLKLSRLGRMVSDTQSVDLRSLIDEVIQSHQTQIHKQSVTIETTLDVPSVQADANRLAVVMDNLLFNALKYACNSPPSRIELGSLAFESEVRLFVRDHGPGIDPEHFETVFGLFQQLDPRREGSGVGLAIVRRVMEVHHGRAWVESTPGAGATFWLALPLHDVKTGLEH